MTKEPLTADRIVAVLFKSLGYEWSFSDGKRVPVTEEIEKTIAAGVKALRESEDNTQIEVGRLIIKKKGRFFDVYAHVGEWT